MRGMSDLPLGSLRHLLYPRADKARGGRPLVKASDVILGALLLTTVLVLLVEAAFYLVSALLAETPGLLQ